MTSGLRQEDLRPVEAAVPARLPRTVLQQPGGWCVHSPMSTRTSTRTRTRTRTRTCTDTHTHTLALARTRARHHRHPTPSPTSATPSSIPTLATRPPQAPPLGPFLRDGHSTIWPAFTSPWLCQAMSETARSSAQSSLGVGLGAGGVVGLWRSGALRWAAVDNGRNAQCSTMRGGSSGDDNSSFRALITTILF